MAIVLATGIEECVANAPSGRNPESKPYRSSTLPVAVEAEWP